MASPPQSLELLERSNLMLQANNTAADDAHENVALNKQFGFSAVGISVSLLTSNIHDLMNTYELNPTNHKKKVVHLCLIWFSLILQIYLYVSIPIALIRIRNLKENVNEADNRMQQQKKHKWWRNFMMLSMYFCSFFIAVLNIALTSQGFKLPSY
jgi:hypothetical protein